MDLSLYTLRCKPAQQLPTYHLCGAVNTMYIFAVRNDTEYFLNNMASVMLYKLHFAGEHFSPQVSKGDVHVSCIAYVIALG